MVGPSSLSYVSCSKFLKVVERTSCARHCAWTSAQSCPGVCSKRPTEEFFSQEFGLPLTMVPNFEDLSCEMKFGQTPPPFEEDDAYNEPCFQHVCSLADRDASKPCPKIDTERWRRR